MSWRSARRAPADLVGTQLGRRPAAAAARLCRRASQDAWLIGRGWNQELWPEKRFPTAADLDAVVRDRPVVLERVDGHAVVANSAALKAAGVTARDPAAPDGRPESTNGLFVDAATRPGRRQGAARTAGRTRRGAGQGPGDPAVGRRHRRRRHGHVGRRTGMRCAAPGDAGRLNVRIMSYLVGTESLRRSPQRRPAGSTGTGCARSGSSFTPTARSARAAPGSSSPMPTSRTRAGCNSIATPSCSSMADAAAAHGFQVAIHAIGDAANAQVIGVYEELSRKYGRRPALADRAFPDRRPRRHPAPRAGRDHRLDAADAPDQRPADGRRAAGPEPAGGRLCLADGAEDRREARIRDPTFRSNRPTRSRGWPRRSAGRT